MGQSRTPRDILDLRAVLQKGKRHTGEENPTTHQKTELCLIATECQERHPAAKPLPVRWRSNVLLISLHHLILQSYQVLIYHIGLPTGKQVKNQ